MVAVVCDELWCAVDLVMIWRALFENGCSDVYNVSPDYREVPASCGSIPNGVPTDPRTAGSLGGTACRPHSEATTTPQDLQANLRDVCLLPAQPLLSNMLVSSSLPGWTEPHTVGDHKHQLGMLVAVVGEVLSATGHHRHDWRV